MIARRFAGYWPYGLIQSVATKIKMKAMANATKEKVLSFVRLCMIAPPDLLAILERRAPSRLFSDICEIDPTNKLSFSGR